MRHPGWEDPEGFCTPTRIEQNKDGSWTVEYPNGKEATESPAPSGQAGLAGYACIDCLEWEKNTFYKYEGVVNTGICSGLTNDSKVEIEVQAGWSGGVVGDIETDQDFFCANFAKRET